MNQKKILSLVVVLAVACGGGLNLSDPNEVVTEFTDSRLSTSLTSETVRDGLCKSKREEMLRKSDQDIFTLANGSGVGNCRYTDQSNACASYVKVDNSEWLNHGWGA
jgi:hypothetical protein